jgi:predicted metal-binding membrane protein
MESATLRRVPPLPSVVQLGLIFGLLLLAAIAWALTGDRMAGMDAGPGTDLGSLGFWVVSWVVMMAAMMFPSIAPMVVMHARVEEGKRRQGKEVPAGTTALFIGGYLLTWTLAGLIGYAIIQIGESLSLGFLSWDSGGPYVAGVVLIAAAIYQLTPLKDVCQRHCRSPMAFLLMDWRTGRVGSLRMGLEHGAWCVGCCWGLMAALFALGVMSIGWMVFVAALIAAEKLLPWRIAANRAIAALLVVVGLGVAFAADDVPGLTVPDSPAATRAMDSMGMGGSDQNGSMNDQKMPSGGGSMGGHSMNEKSMNQPTPGGMNGAKNGTPAP